jgi:putative spermidine/putrescine transport system substrate-binding protein
MTLFSRSGISLKTPLGALAVAIAAMAPGLSQAQTKTLYIGMNGGVMEKTWTSHVFPAFEKANNVKVVVVPGTSSEILAKAQANKDRPQMHVMFLDDGVMIRAAGMGLCEKLKPSPALNEIFPTARFKDDIAAGVTMGMTGLAYNKKMFAERAGPHPPPGWIWLTPNSRAKWSSNPCHLLRLVCMAF